MSPVLLTLLLSGPLCGVLDTHPDYLLQLKCVRQPGEPDVAFFRRESARIDAVMQWLIAKNERDVARNQDRERRFEQTLRLAGAEGARRRLEAMGLQAVGGWNR
ncbi:MAG: hypothetical protein MUF18_08200 [Fimbriiglobus sp.]|nr:hypothetical protein [Fimbriiglobus sp.]